MNDRTKGNVVWERSKGRTRSGVGDQQRGKAEEENWQGEIKGMGGQWSWDGAGEIKEESW